MADKDIKYKEFPFSGKLITSVDGTQIGENFTVLQNFRYTNTGIRGIAGMTKINTTAIPTYPKIRNVFHFNKERPSESHLLVQGYNSGLTASQVLQNTTAIPNQGDFAAAALHTDAANASRGYFSDAPDGSMAYCNSKESMIWGGDEARCAGFISYDPGGSFSYDYTDVINNTLDDTKNVATISSVSAGIDSNTMLILHGNNNTTDDSPTTSHTVTFNGTARYDASTKKFGSHAFHIGPTSGSRDTADYLSIPDDADFDFSGGIFTIDCWGYLKDLAADSSIYYQQTDANNYFSLYVDTNGAVILSIYAASSEVVNVTTPNGTIAAATMYHIELVENSNDWYIFVGGVQKGYTSDSSRAADYTGVVRIGGDGTNAWWGPIDEFRVSNVARHISGFEVPSLEYTTSASSPSIYIGAIRPLKGIKFYVKTANATAGTMSAEYWDGSAWIGVSSLSDGTDSGGVSLAQTGSVTFDDTKDLANVKIINGIVLYWYKISITVADSSTTIYYCTVDASFQPIKDLWDGEFRIAQSFQIYDGSTYNDNTVNVFEEDYSSANTATYSDIGSLTTGTDYFVVGSVERLMGVNFVLIGGKVNTAAGTVCTVKYWTGSDWASVGTIEDGTIEGGISMAKSGTISWSQPTSNTEFKQNIGRDENLYYYRFEFDTTLSASVYADFVGGISAQKEILGYKLPVFAHNRLLLCSNQDSNKNTVLISAEHSSSVFNGEDSIELTFNDDKELVAGVGLYRQFGSTLYNVIILTKTNQTWILIGNGPEDWVQYQASKVIGCVAPLTMQTAHVSFEAVPGQSRYIAIWQGNNGVYMFDGANIRPVHEDIKDYFDQRNSYAIKESKIADSVSFFDIKNQEYHWLFASGTATTTLNKELVFDVERQKWHEPTRGSGNELQAGTVVMDTDGNEYIYGALDSGYIERLDNGTDFDGVDIVHTVETGDIAPEEGSVTTLTIAKRLKLLLVAKNTTSNSISITHYGDTKTIGDSFTATVSAADRRVLNITKGLNYGPHIFHKIKLSITTNDENVGCEPLYMGIGYKIQGVDKR